MDANHAQATITLEINEAARFRTDAGYQAEVFRKANEVIMKGKPKVTIRHAGTGQAIGTYSRARGFVAK